MITIVTSKTPKTEANLWPVLVPYSSVGMDYGAGTNGCPELKICLTVESVSSLSIQSCSFVVREIFRAAKARVLLVASPLQHTPRPNVAKDAEPSN